MKRTILKAGVAALAAAMVSSVLADRTYDQPGTTTFTSAETETGYVKIESSSGAFDSDWQVWTTDGTEGAGLTLPKNCHSLSVAWGNELTGRLKIEDGLYAFNQADQINGNYKWSPFFIGVLGGVGYYWQIGGSVTATDNAVVIGGSGDANQRGVGHFLLEGGSFVNTSSDTIVGYGYGSGTFEMTGGTFETKGIFQIVEGPGSDCSASVSGGEFTVGTILDIGHGNANCGVGTFTASGDAVVKAQTLNVGSGATEGRCMVSGGTITLTDNNSGNGALQLGKGSTSYGELIQSGGTISVPQNCWASVGHSGSGESSYTMTGGTFDMYADGNNGAVVLGRNDTTKGTLSVSGTGTFSTRRILFGEQSGATGILNLGVGGTVAVKFFECNGTGNINFNGGTLKALDSNSAFIPSRISLNVGASGAVLDANGKTITIAATFPGGASSPLLLKSATGAVTLSAVTSGEKLYVNFSAPEDFPEGTYNVPSVTVTTGNEIEYAVTTLDGKFNLTWDTTANTVTISATEENTAMRKTLAADWTIQDSDETDLSGTAFAMGDYVIDLNGHDLTLGSWSAASGALVTNSSETAAMLILATSADQVSGNNFATFGGNLTIKVCGSNTTTFNPELTNTHTGGWIFENNDYNVQIKYHTDQMGTGPVVFNGNGGFTPYYPAGSQSDANNYYEKVLREIEVTGKNNTFVSTVNAAYCEFLRFTKLTGDGELRITGSRTFEAADKVDAITSDWSEFEGTIIIDGVDMFIWYGNNRDFKKTTFRLDNWSIYARATDTTGNEYHIGDICTPFASRSSTVKVDKQQYGRAGATFYVGYLNNDSTYAGDLTGALNFTKVGTGSWTLAGNITIAAGNVMTVNDGRLNVMLTADANSAFLVNSDGTLGGSGAINGSLTVNGTVAPGTNTAETLTVAGTTTFNSGAKLAATIGTDGASSCLALTASDEVSLANLKFQIPDVSQLRHNSGYTYTLLTAENGSISGKPRFVSGMRTTYGADGSRWILGVDGTSVKLTETTMGFAVIIR